MPIETVSEISGVDIPTLLKWERVFHLHLSPEHVGTQTRYRRGDIEVVMTIRRLIHGAGFSEKSVHKALKWIQKRAA